MLSAQMLSRSLRPWLHLACVTLAAGVLAAAQAPETASPAADGAKSGNIIGKVAAGSPAFLAFTRHGWAWGGFYPSVTDYMHFYKSLVGFSPNPLEREYEAPTLTYLPRR